MKPLPAFNLHQPETTAEALELMATLENVKPIAGGTDLIPLIRSAVCNPLNLVDLTTIQELNYVTEQDGYICIGGNVTHSQLAASPQVSLLPALLDAVTRIGSPQIRNLGTLAGNILNASPAADAAPPLLVHDAEATLSSVDGARDMPVSEIFEGPKINCLEPNEVLTEIRAPLPPPNTGSSYKRIGRRSSFTLSVVGAASYIELDGDTCKEARFAFGSVDETPVRAPEAEAELTGNTVTQSSVDAACEAAMQHVNPITDIRGTAEYRRDMCGVLLRRAISEALERAR